ncbi:hypothetical protein HOY82DRAFT_605521 [Tuber indicum]|nr:hypothetical protein HOY82DRAFT_605521 [Tuber indicum]
MPFPDIAKELGIVAARSTIESVFHLHHNIFRRRQIYKLYLCESHIESRLAFAHMALHIAVHTIDPHRWAIHDHNDEGTIRLMFWGAIALGQRGPYHIWQKDTEEDKLCRKQLVDEENGMHAHCTAENQAKAYEEGTWQYNALHEFNQNIERINIEEGHTGRH